MFIIILSVCGVIGVAHVHPLVRRTSATVVRFAGRCVVAYGISYAHVRFPWAFIPDETRYAAWLESHRDERISPDATLPAGGPNVSRGSW